jgi:hypothetical protein
MIFFTIHVHWKHVFNFIKDKKNKFCLWGYFSIFTLVFCVINRECFEIFQVFFSNFLLKNMLACIPNEPASGWSPRHSCDATRWPNLDIRRLTGYAIVSPSTWCGTCRSMVVESSQLVICFCFFFSLLTTKVHRHPFCCLIFNFSPSSLNFISDVKCE